MSAKDIIQAFPTPASGGILSTIDKEACEKAVAQILEGGENILRELTELLVEPGKGNDVQARHAIHATAIRADRHPAADDLAHRGQIRCYAISPLASSIRPSKSTYNLIKNQQNTVSCR